MQQRLDYRTAAPRAYKALLGVEAYIQKSGLEISLIELVRTRASQINGCTWCLEMHTKDARAQGETEQRLYLLAAWREAHCYTGRERAALAWTEAVTQIGNAHGVPDAVYEEARRHFSEQELIDLTMVIVSINSWNRMNVAFQLEVRDYVSPHGANG